MHRRNFLKGIMALPALLIAPMPVRAEPFTVTKHLRQASYQGKTFFIGNAVAPATAPVNYYLDDWARLYGVCRKPGETDTLLRSRIVDRAIDGFK